MGLVCENREMDTCLSRFPEMGKRSEFAAYSTNLREELLYPRSIIFTHVIHKVPPHRLLNAQSTSFIAYKHVKADYYPANSSPHQTLQPPHSTIILQRKPHVLHPTTWQQQKPNTLKISQHTSLEIKPDPRCNRFLRLDHQHHFLFIPSQF